MTHQHAVLEDTVFFWFASNDTSGSGDDGASAAADVRLAGAAAGAAPVLSPVPTLLTHASFPPGAYEVAVAATAANGFAATNTYAVFCTLAVDGQNPTGFIGSFTLDPIIANIKEVSDDSGAADNLELDYDGTGYAKVNSTIGITTTNADMRGTDGAALASVLGALADVAADGDPTAVDTAIQYLKQLVNIFVGTTGIVTFPAAAAPANNVSLAEVIRAIYDDVTGLNGDVMRGTDGANTVVPDPAGTAPTVSEIGDAVWDEDIVAAHGGADSAGLLVRALGALISQRVNNATLNALLGVADVAGRDIPEQVWAEGTRDLTALGFVLDTADFAASFLTAALIATDAITSDELAASAINEIRDGILDDATRFSGANIDAAISTRATPAQVNTEVSDVLKVDTVTLPGQAAPPLTPTMEEILAWVFKTFRNKKTQTTTQWNLYDDAGAVIDSKATISDAAAVATKEEIVSGP